MAPPVVFPAYAGVNLAVELLYPELISIPRVCGGEPIDSKVEDIRSLYSPRMRG